MAVDDQSRGFGSARFGRRGSAAEFQRLAEAEALLPVVARGPFSGRFIEAERELTKPLAASPHLYGQKKPRPGGGPGLRQRKFATASELAATCPNRYQASRGSAFDYPFVLLLALIMFLPSYLRLCSFLSASL